MKPLDLFLFYATPVIGLFIMAFIAIVAVQIRLSVSRKVGAVMDILFLLPLVLPVGTISGLLEQFAFSFFSPSQGYYIVPFLGSLVCASIAEFAILYLCTLLGFQQVKDGCIDAARMQGLCRLGVLWHVQLPQSRRLILAGLGLGCLWMLSAGGLGGAILSIIPIFLIPTPHLPTPLPVVRIILQLIVAISVLVLLLRLGRRHA